MCYMYSQINGTWVKSEYQLTLDYIYDKNNHLQRCNKKTKWFNVSLEFRGSYEEI